MTNKCNCGRRTPFAHKHAETCPCFVAQMVGRFEHQAAPTPVDYASDFAEAFQLIFEGYNRPADNFETDTAWATWQHGQLRKAFPIMQRLRSKQSDPTDELGKVWDVLHAAGINSASASEGVKLLAGQFTVELVDEYQALQEAFAKLKAREDAARTLLHDAWVSLYAKGMSQYEQPRVAMIAWLEE